MDEKIKEIEKMVELQKTVWGKRRFEILHLREVEYLLSEVKRLQLFQRLLCPECLQMLEPDGSCLTCRMAKEVKRLQGVVDKLTKPDFLYWYEQYQQSLLTIKRLKEVIERHIEGSGNDDSELEKLVEKE